VVVVKKNNKWVSRLPPPPPPPRLLSLVPSPPSPPHPQLRCCWVGHLWLWCFGRGVLSREGWSVNYDSAADIFDGSEPWENSAGAQETGDDQQQPLPPPPAPLGSLIRDMETNGGRGGGKAWPTHGPTYARLVLESCSIHNTSWM
jgi:hypothetical protein